MKDLTTKDRIRELKLRVLDMEQADCPLFHHFNKGIYVREIRPVEGQLIIGKKHKFRHLSVLLEGKIRMLLPDETSVELTAPFKFMSDPGSKVFIALSDSVFVNVLQTEETDIQKIEDYFIEKDPDVVKRLTCKENN